MCHQSPAKLMRNVRRIAKYNERRAPNKTFLTIKCVNSVDIPPTKKCIPNLSVVFVQQTEISPKLKPILSISTATLIDIHPEAPRSHAISIPSLPTNLPQPRKITPSLAPPTHWSSSPNCLPPHLRTRPSLVSPFTSGPYPTGPQTTSKPTKNLLQSLWWSRTRCCYYCSIFLPTWKVFCSPLCA